MEKLSNEEAEYLLALPKKILHKNDIFDDWLIRQSFGMKLRLTLISTDEEFTFLWQIWLSEKDALKVSLHHQDCGTNLGLLRVDFNSGHKNPESANEFVPGKFLPYINKHFTPKEHHIHYHVQTYESLAWAVPLSADDFEIKEIGMGADFAADFDRTIRQFAKAINLQTKLTFEALLI